MSDPQTDAIKKLLDGDAGESAIVISALLDYLRASRRAKLAEVAAIERFERTLTTQRASQPSQA